MDSIVRWYIERAMEEERNWFKDDEECLEVFETWKQECLDEFAEKDFVDSRTRVLLRALELAVKDVG